jgi:hypothetical protein
MNTSFNQRIGRRLFTSEEELVSALHATLDIVCDRQQLDKQRLIDAAHTVAPEDFVEWQILEWAISGAQTMTHKNRDCGVSLAYKGIKEITVADDACGKCDGTGKYIFTSGAVGICYQCNGKGKE